jgi:hypothetical protein
MKNGINTSQFRMKTGSRGNGRKTPSLISVNTETGPRKYGNERTKLKNGIGRNGNFSVRFQRYHRSLAQEPTSTSPARSQVPSSLAAMVTSSYALAPSPCYACLDSHTVAAASIGGRSSSQQPPEAQRVAQMEVAGAQNLQAAACRRREADPVGGRRWLAGKRRACHGQRRPAYGLRAAVIHRRGRVMGSGGGPHKTREQR